MLFVTFCKKLSDSNKPLNLRNLENDLHVVVQSCHQSAVLVVSDCLSLGGEVRDFTQNLIVVLECKEQGFVELLEVFELLLESDRWCFELLIATH